MGVLPASLDALASPGVHVTDREFVREVGPWGFATMVAAMLGISFARFTDGLGLLQSFGYSLVALLLVPIIWFFAGRYASYWLSRATPKNVVQALFIAFWALLTAKLFFLPWPDSISLLGTAAAVLCAAFSAYAAAQSFRRVAAGDIQPLRDTTVLPWLLHPLLIAAFAILLLT